MWRSTSFALRIVRSSFRDSVPSYSPFQHAECLYRAETLTGATCAEEAWTVRDMVKASIAKHVRNRGRRINGSSGSCRQAILNYCPFFSLDLKLEYHVGDSSDPSGART